MLFKLALGLAACSFALLALAPSASAECCNVDNDSKCADGTIPENWYCGAYGGGGCNAFGCNCGGGCIPYSPHRRARSAEARKPDPGSATGLDVVRDADTDGNGALDHLEIAVYFRRQGRTLEERDWRALDTNQDGQLTAHEIDSDLGAVTA